MCWGWWSSYNINLHIGTNDLDSESASKTHAASIINQYDNLLSDKRNVKISRIAPRSEQWKNKGSKVNTHLKLLFEKDKMNFTDYKNIIDQLHWTLMNRSKLHLNTKGLRELSGDFVSCIYINFNWIKNTRCPALSNKQPKEKMIGTTGDRPVDFVSCLNCSYFGKKLAALRRKTLIE